MPALLAIADLSGDRFVDEAWVHQCATLAREHGFTIALMADLGESGYDITLQGAGIRLLGGYDGSAISRANQQKISSELHRQPYDLLHLTGGSAVVNGVRAAKGWAGKVVTDLGPIEALHWWSRQAYSGHLHSRVDAIFCPTTTDRERIRGFLFFDVGKAIVVGSGCGLDDSVQAAKDLEERFKIHPEREIVAVVAHGPKGLDYLGEAIRRLPADLGLHFLFIGPGLQTPDFESFLTDSYYAHQYSFAGPAEEELPLLSAAAMVVFPNVSRAGLYQRLLASLNLGLPTLYTLLSSGGDLDLPAEVAGRFQPKDEEALRDAIQLLAEERDARNRLGEAGRRYAVETLHPEKSAARLALALNNVLA